jgi:hypothetical protein
LKEVEEERIEVAEMVGDAAEEEIDKIESYR